MSVGYEASVLAGRNLRRFLRSPRLLGDAITFPLILLVLLLVMFGEVVGGATDEPYIARLARGSCCSASPTAAWARPSVSTPTCTAGSRGGCGPCRSLGCPHCSAG